MKRETAEEREIVREAQQRFKACQDWEGQARQRWNDDQKFAEGDSDNQYQWDTQQVVARQQDPNGARPCLTINKTRQHNLQILNDARQNKAGIEIRPTGDGATYDAAKIFEGVVRHIEYRSNAVEAYEAASRHQIYGGWGYWRILTEYVDHDSFDQDIKIQRVADPLSIYLDPDIEEFDGSDARYGFVFRDVPNERFKTEHPQWKDLVGSKALCDEGKTWDDGEHMRVAEYYRKREVPDTLYSLNDGTTILRSEMDGEILEQFDLEKPDRVRAERRTMRVVVEWFKIAGSRIVDRRTWPGKYIPLVRVIGEETVIDGKLDRKGHTRALKDPQRMYNFWSSAAVEHIALQGKSPYVAPVQAIEGYEQYWDNANRVNYSVLPYNGFDDEGKPIAAPQRQAPPQASTAYVSGMQAAAQELMMASGQYQAEMGAPSNERSGVAIQQRQRQGDNATYHYIDHLAQAIRFTGRILIDLIPKIYDVERVVKIMAENGEQQDVRIDPNGDKPVQKMVGGQPVSDEQLKAAQADPNLRDQVETIFNPNVGRYAVEADIGPAYATRRQEAFAALSDLLQRSPALASIAGDILFKAADFPMADEVAERIKRTIPPAVLGEGVSPQEQQLQQQLQQAQQAIQQLQGMLNEKGQQLASEHEGREDRHALDSYRAETDRMKAIGGLDPEAMRPVLRELIADVLGVHPMMLPAPAMPAQPGVGTPPNLPGMA
ncbi:portal protein [Methylobacterium sp. yr596]|uniref:portal protein n=1 Tax=Methylobacterium sp. yr596 TaxID=1761800 RepID=UPI0008E44165|nr:portal protein [Methylobacterium sp. yr596]SFF76863.1 Phage P22-like portal protein [Methylobacterium sp. yr596]